MNNQIQTLNNIGSLCRIKVNKMLSSISNKNIFIPKYTLTNRNEEKYLSSFNKSKQKSNRASCGKINNIKNINFKIKNKKTHKDSTEDKYNKHKIDFIIDHGVLVYQRNIKEKDIINIGINNENSRKNKFTVTKNENSKNQTDSNFKSINRNHKYMSNKESISHRKRIDINNSRKKLISMSDLILSNSKNVPIHQYKIFSENLNSTQNSKKCLNSFSNRNFYDSSKNKTLFSNNNKKPFNTKKFINSRKKKNITKYNKFLIIRKKRNLTSFIANDESQIKNINDNKTLPKVIENNFKTIYLDNNKIEEEIKFNKKFNKLNNKISSPINDIKKLVDKNMKNIFTKIFKIVTDFYLKKYFNILKNNILKYFNNSIVENKNITNNIDIKDINNKINKRDNIINKIDINKILIKKERPNKNKRNSLKILIHKKSKSISVNKAITSNNSSAKELSTNVNKYNNFTLIITKNFKFFSKDDNDGKKESELYRNSLNLQKKFEQISRRKKRDLSMTYSRKFKPFQFAFENNNLTETYKTNSCSIINDNNSENNLKISKIKEAFNQLFSRDNSSNNNNNKDKKNLEENKVDKKIYQNFKNNKKDVNSYRIIKSNSKINSKEENNIQNFTEIKNTNINNNLKKQIIKKKNFIKGELEILNNYFLEKITNDINKKCITHKKNNYELEQKKNLNIKETGENKGTKRNKSVSIDIKNRYIKYLIKNICTKDKRIYIHITYIPQINQSKSNNYNNKKLLIENIMNFNYIGFHQKNKYLIKRNNDLENKLSLIKEEDEKSKYFNSTNSIKYFDEDELYSSKLNNKKIRIIIDKKGYNSNISKIINLLDTIIFNRYILNKKEFIIKLKIIYLISFVKKIINNKLKDTNFYKLMKKIQKTKKLYFPNIRKKKMKKIIKKISNINIKDKKILNSNLFIKDKTIFGPHSFDINKENDIFKSPNIIEKISSKNKKDKDYISNYFSKTENRSLI